MAASDPSQPTPQQETQKADSLRLVSETKEQVARIVVAAGKALEAAQLVREVIGPVQEILIYAPANVLTSAQWDHLSGTFHALHSVAKEAESGLTLPNTLYATAYAVTSTSSDAIVSVIQMGSFEHRPRALTARSRLNQIFERAPLLEKVGAEMTRVGLDHAHSSRRSPAALVGEAQAAVQRPTGPKAPPLSSFHSESLSMPR
jgi:hypothetical protein